MSEGNLTEGREVAARTARELGYSYEFIERIKNAKTRAEISRILVAAREEKIDKDIDEMERWYDYHHDKRRA